MPFCCAMGHEGSPLHAPSAVQVSVRPPLVHSASVASTISETQLQFLQDKYPNFEMLEASSRVTVGRHKATYVRGTFTVITSPQHNIRVRLSILSRIYLVFSAQGAFNIGLSGSSEPGQYVESEFEQLLSSVQIDMQQKREHN